MYRVNKLSFYLVIGQIILLIIGSISVHAGQDDDQRRPLTAIIDRSRP